MLREAEEDEGRAEQDRDDAGRVRPLVALEERRLRRRRDLIGVLRILLGDPLGTVERLGQLALDAGRDVLAGAGNRCPHRGREAGRQQRTEDRLHDRTAQVTLQVRRPRRHPRPLHGHGAGERVRSRGAGESDPDPDERVAEPHLPVGDVVLPEQEHGEEAEQAEGIAREQCQPSSLGLDELGRTRRDHHHERRGRQDCNSRFERGIAEDVLEELLADEHRAHE